MRIFLIAAMALVAFLTACDRAPVPKEQATIPKDSPGQWILESYNIDKGYVLRKDGVTYVAACSYYYWGPISKDENNPGEPKLSVMPGHGVSLDGQDNRGECTAILAYIHKPVPFQQYPSYPPDRLFFLKIDAGSTYVQGITEFTIIEAK